MIYKSYNRIKVNISIHFRMIGIPNLTRFVYTLEVTITGSENKVQTSKRGFLFIYIEFYVFFDFRTLDERSSKLLTDSEYIFREL